MTSDASTEPALLRVFGDGAALCPNVVKSSSSRLRNRMTPLRNRLVALPGHAHTLGIRLQIAQANIMQTFAVVASGCDSHVSEQRCKGSEAGVS